MGIKVEGYGTPRNDEIAVGILTSVVDSKLFIPDLDLYPISEKFRIRILDCASY
jgi:hypothetical protein